MVNKNIIKKSMIVMLVVAILMFVSISEVFAANTVSSNDLEDFMSIDSGSSQSSTKTTTTTEKTANTSGSAGTGNSTGTGTSSGNSTTNTSANKTNGTTSGSSQKNNDVIPETGSNTEVIFTVGATTLICISIYVYKKIRY